MPTNSTKQTLYDLLIDTLNTIKSDECMIWPYAVDGHGYGQLIRHRKHIPVHRIAFHFANGHWPVPVARHTCDKPRCFNPQHIVAGTMKQNSEDMVARGRMPHGDQHYRSKLTPEDVHAIRSSVKSTYFNGSIQLAIKYGVSRSTISDILRKRTWCHLS